MLSRTEPEGLMALLNDLMHNLSRRADEIMMPISYSSYTPSREIYTSETSKKLSLSTVERCGRKNENNNLGAEGKKVYAY